MKHHNFKAALLGRLIVIILTGWLSGFLLLKESMLLFIWPTIIVITGIIELFSFLNKENQKVYYYLLALSENIFSGNLIKKHCSPSIINAGETLRNRVKHLSEQKTINHIFLEHVTDHVDTGLICYDDRHEVRFINTCAKKILNRNTLLNIDNLQHCYETIYETLLNPSQYRNKVIDFSNNGNTFALLVKSVHFTVKERIYTLVSLKDIKEQLEERDIYAWHNLVRYLSHEILNSVIPIANLSDYVKKQLIAEDAANNKEEMVTCLETVSHRSKSLVGVLNSARQLSHLPKPTMRVFLISDLFYRVVNLLNPKFKKYHINVQTDIHIKDITLTADFDLIEQVLINLLNNAVDALNKVNNPLIRLVCDRQINNRVFIRVENNGESIPKDNLEKIFVPFFTTRKNGTGIGLSLSRQIMHLHKGILSVSSQQKKTIFTMEFNQKQYDKN